MSSKVLTAAFALCALAASAQAQTVTGEAVSEAVKATAAVDAKVAEAPAKKALDAVKDAPPAIVSGSLSVSPSINVPAAVSASLPSVPASATVPVSATLDGHTTGGVTTLDEAFAAISATTSTAVEPETTTMEGRGEKLEDYMKDAARPAGDAAVGDGIIPMPPDGDDMMGY